MSLIDEGLRTEIEGILRNYSVPMDDRGLVLEKVELALEGERRGLDQELGRIQEGIELDRTQVRHELDDMKHRAHNALGDLSNKVQDAYEEGFQDGLSSGGSPGLLHWAVGAAVVGLGVYLGLKGLVRRWS